MRNRNCWFAAVFASSQPWKSLLVLLCLSPLNASQERFLHRIRAAC
jgi:hypothetical protein